MAEAVAAPLGIATVQGSWFLVKKIRDSHPKRRLQKWEEKVAKALQGVDGEYLKIKPSDLEKLMQKHAQYYSILPNIGYRFSTYFFSDGRPWRMNLEQQ